MALSIKEVAEILGKTRRQVTYLIEQGELPAQKARGRWVIERADLKVDAKRKQRVKRKQAQFQAVIEEAVLPGNQRYTLRDLKAVQLAMPIYRQLAERGAGSKQAAAHMRECLDQLAVGCYRYDRQDKTLAYRAARDAREAIAVWLAEHRALRLNPMHLAIEPTQTPVVLLGYRISRAGISPSRKLRRRFRNKLRTAAGKSEEALCRTIRSYQGLLLFP